MSEIFNVLHNIFKIAFAVIPGSIFIMALPFIVGVGIIKFIRNI